MSASPVMPRRLAVLLPLPLAGAYDYALPDDLDAAPGDYVRVPLGGRTLTGVVWGEALGAVAPAKLKPILARLDFAPFPLLSRRFVDWVAQYTLSPPGAVLKMAMSVPDALDAPPDQVVYAPAPAPPARLAWTPARLRVREALGDRPPQPLAELARLAKVGPGVVKGLAEAGGLIAQRRARDPRPGRPDADAPGPILSTDQQKAAQALVASPGFAVALLDGVTGSGKTEVYFEAIAACLRQGRQALVLLPEIALSAQWLARFEARFGAPPVVWHSDLTHAARRAAWRATALGEAKVVVGARSALFLPFADLGLLVVDEEHEGAYKQEEGTLYHARDMAVVRARLSDCQAVLVSATPAIETLVNVESGRYRRLHLPDRHGGALLPAIAAIDLRRDPPERGRWLAPPLVKAIEDCLAAGEQALLFLNRRGYAPLTLCRACGHRLQCPNCSAWLVLHQRIARLQCHHCGHAMMPPGQCPACQAEGSLVACGPGVERLAEEAARRFPKARLAQMTSDTVSGPKAAAELVRRMSEREIDLLVGTQIIAKGHHFPWLTLVGVVDADLGLEGGDLRAGERCFQLLSQVSGRAGRAERPGRVLLQTWMPEHPVIAALVANDRDRFLEAETQARREAHMPPFGRLVALIVSGPDVNAVEAHARALARAAPKGEGIVVLGPAPAPLALLRGQHRRRLLLQTRRDLLPQPLVRDWLGGCKAPGRVRVQADVDPYSFF
ncbi:MAG: primosomal protein N' [Rhodospirillales bacterium]|nr:primosomal protein N' [Rhodospirillales bacterium]